MVKLWCDILPYVIPIGGNQKYWEYTCGLLPKFLVRKSATFQRNGKVKGSEFHLSSQAVCFHVSLLISVQYWKLIYWGESVHWIQGDSDSSLESFLWMPPIPSFPFLDLCSPFTRAQFRLLSLLPMLGAKLLKKYYHFTLQLYFFLKISPAHGGTLEHCIHPWKEQEGFYHEY